MAGSKGRGIVGRIWEKVCDLLLNSDAVKSKTDQFEFVDGKLRTTGEDGSGGGGLDQDILDELIELNGKVALDDTSDLILASTQNIELSNAGILNETSFRNKLLQVDTVGSTTYVGYASAGTATSSATWAITKVVETGQDVSITWADGDRLFNNVWNDRLILTYS